MKRFGITFVILAALLAAPFAGLVPSHCEHHDKAPVRGASSHECTVCTFAKLQHPALVEDPAVPDRVGCVVAALPETTSLPGSVPFAPERGRAPPTIS